MNDKREKTVPVNTRGGSRPGAGRKPTGRKRHFYYVTDEEDAKIKELLEQLRKNQN